jgi:hypothetical protein
MESLSPFLWRTYTSYNMPVYPGARRVVGKPEATTLQFSVTTGSSIALACPGA